MNPDLTNPFLLFVYGGLMTDGRLHPAMQGARLIGPARTREDAQLLDLGTYPGLVHAAEGGRAVVGELFEVPLALVPHLDEVEGAPTLYRLEPVQLHDCDQPVFSYFYRGSAPGVLYAADRWDNTRQTRRTEGGS
jgi:gamma-glutamylcyclotransferase (GGCT)/AIG2-like uncharacterized protein YtfP